MHDLAALLSMLIRQKFNFSHEFHSDTDPSQSGATVRVDGVRFDFNALGELTDICHDLGN